jgi:hypothetical protein
VTRPIKLLLNLSLAAVLFIFFTVLLLALLNPGVALDTGALLRIGLRMLPFYGPLNLLFATACFFMIQFFAAHHYVIGLLRPPTPLYFVTFTTLIATLVLYFNYLYYRAFLSPAANARYLQALGMCVALLLAGMLFMLLNRRRRRWPKLVVAGMLLVTVGYTARLIRHPVPAPAMTIPSPSPPPKTTRKLKIVIMEGLSLEFLLSLSLDQKLPNFSWIRENGVTARLTGFRPGFELALLNTLLSGQRPNSFARHSDVRFRIPNLNVEFDTLPRYIFMRSAARLGSIYFYQDRTSQHVDRLRDMYADSGRATFTLVRPETPPTFTGKQLKLNNAFIQLFADLPKTRDPKLDILEKSFFYDDFLRRLIPDLRTGQYHYSLVRLNGLEKVTRAFYHYARPELFGKIDPADIKTYGWILERYYHFYDMIAGNLIASMGDNEMLVLLSLNEPVPLPLWRRILVNYAGDKDVFVYKPTLAQGVALMYEKTALKKGLFLESVSLSDIFPTLLYYAGFPLIKNLDGDVLRDIFSEEFAAQNPVYF